MKKTTSKSASEQKKASSRSGTSKKMADTASQSQTEPASKFDFIIVRAKKRTPAQTRARLMEVGILTPKGDLAPQYETIKTTKAQGKKAMKQKTRTKKQKKQV